MNTQLVLVCEHHHSDMDLYRYEWPRLVSAPPLLVVETAPEALAFLRNCVETYGPVPSLVICEINLPDGGGFKILNYIKSTSALQDVPVILTGEFLPPEVVRQANEKGALECWRKPISLEALRPVLEPLSR